MCKTKERVHNEKEARALMKEALQRGEIDLYDGTEWRTHEDKYLFTTQKPFPDCDDELNCVDLTKDIVVYVATLKFL